MNARQTRQLVQYTLTYIAIVLGIAGLVQLIAVFSPDFFSQLSPPWKGAGYVIIFTIPAIATYAWYRYAHRLDPTNDADAPAISYDLTSPQHIRNRENVIANVRAGYIEGVLCQSMPERVRLNLGMQELPDVLLRREARWEGQPRPLSVSNSEEIYQLYVEGGRSLLILGAPGSGKTITMLELCDRLLADATPESPNPIPVVINLSSWAEHQKPLADWLDEELDRQYGLAKKVTPVWLAHDQLCLLLDGLDEVRQDVRDDCVLAINDFRARHTTPTIVCSRIADYELLSERLNLSRALVIQPLDDEQIAAYLTHPDLRLDAVYNAVQQDDALAALATTPLMLNVMAVAYEGATPAELEPLLQDEARRRRDLYNRYIRRVFQRKPWIINNYSPNQALIWLRYLARQMTVRAQTQFFIEDLQFDWLPSGRRRARFLDGALLVGVPFGIVGGVLSGVLFGVQSGVLFGILLGALCGFIGGFMLSVGPIMPVDYLLITEPSWQAVATSTRKSFKSLLDGVPGNVRIIAESGVVGGVVGGAVGGVLWGVQSGVVDGILSGIVAGVAGGAMGGAVGGILLGALGVLLGALDYMVLRVQSRNRMQPGQGIRSSASIGWRAGALFGVLGGVLSGVLYGVMGDSLRLVVAGVLVGVLLGVLSGVLALGGDAVLKHYMLRAELARYHYLPFRLAPFMEAMIDRILIQRTAASYRFIHRTFQEHIAILTDDDIERISAPAAENTS